MQSATDPAGLCGRFAVPADSGKLPARKPLTNVHDIRKHLKASPRMSGRKQASAVLPYIIENTRSPREVDVALFCHSRLEREALDCLALQSERKRPIRQAGERETNTAEQAISSRSNATWCGISLAKPSWSNTRANNTTNTNSASIATRSKKLPYRAESSRIHPLSNEQLRDFDQFKRFATLLKETLGIRPRSRISDPEQRQKSLHAQLVRPFAL